MSDEHKEVGSCILLLFILILAAAHAVGLL